MHHAQSKSVYNYGCTKQNIWNDNTQTISSSTSLTLMACLEACTKIWKLQRNTLA